MNLTIPARWRFVLALAAGLALACTGPRASAKTYSTTRKVGETRSYGLRVQLFDTPTVTVDDTRIARAWFDAGRGRLAILGLKEGKTRVHLRGRIRRFIAGTNTPVERPVPFHDVVEVTVRGKVAGKHKSLRLTVSRGRTRTYSAGIFLGTRHRAVAAPVVAGRDVVKVWYETAGKRKVRIRGLKPGRATVVLRCQTWDSNRRQWVDLTYTIHVRVTGATPRRLAGKWSTSCGTMTFNVGAGGKVIARYTEDNGRIIGVLRGRRLIGHWIEDDSTVKCKTKRDGSYYWGRIVLEFDANFTKFTGKWSYDERKPTAAWDGERVKRDG